jgi:hypothetical protein
VLEHGLGDVVTVLELVDEALAVLVEQETAGPAERLGGQELDLGVGLVGVDEAGRVDLDLLHVDGPSADLGGHLVAVAGAVRAVGRREREGVRPVLGEEAVVGKVGGVTSRCEDDGASLLVALAIDLVHAAGDGAVGVGNEVLDLGLFQDLDPLRVVFGELLKLLCMGVSGS